MKFLYNATAEDVETGEQFGTGWLPPLPDLRDYTEETPAIAEMAETLLLAHSKSKSTKALAAAAEAAKEVTEVDLRKWCTEIEDQKNLGSCTAHAAAGIVEYFENRAFGNYVDISRLFVYKATRSLMGVTGDTGAWLRTTTGALTLCGAPAEKYWPYTTVKSAEDGKRTFDDDPPAFVFAVADQIADLKYFCHDPLGAEVPPETTLDSVKKYLANGIPSMFGFYGFPSFSNSDTEGGIPFPCSGEQAQWGHAIVAIGYDDEMEITNTKCDKTTVGALLIRNSWGKKWGDKGYGWLPYDYVLHGLALDFWSLLSMKWIDTDEFGLD